MQKMITAVMLASIMALSGVALADPATPRCDPLSLVSTPGEANQVLHQTNGSPGQAAKTFSIPANEVAAIYNDLRKTACPPPGNPS